MELKDFEALLHIGIVFNFLYTFAHFSEKIASFFSSPFENISSKDLGKLSIYVQSMQDNQALSDPTLNTSSVKSKLEKYFLELQKKTGDLTNPKKYDPEYNSMFKACYFFAGFYTFFLLILATLHNYLHLPTYYKSLFITNLVCLIFLLCVFIYTFSKRGAKIGLLNTLIIFLFVVFIYLLFYNNSNFLSLLDIPDSSCTILFSLTLAFIVPLLHFLRILLQSALVLIFVQVIYYKYNKKFRAINTELKGINLAQAILDKYKNAEGGTTQP